MNPDAPTVRHSNAWNMFTYASFIVAAKGFHAMSALMLVHMSVSITKTLRDNEEASRLINRIEDAKTEKLLMEVGRAA